MGRQRVGSASAALIYRRNIMLHEIRRLSAQLAQLTLFMAAL